MAVDRIDGFCNASKLPSPHFIDETYIGFELVRGGFATPPLKLMPWTNEVVASGASHHTLVADRICVDAGRVASGVHFHFGRVRGAS